MKGTRGAAGSFGIPAEMEQAMKQSKMKGADQMMEDLGTSPTKPVVDTSYAKEDDSDEPEQGKDKVEQGNSREEEDAALAERIEKELGITITEDDLWAFLYKGSLYKKNIIVMPGKYHVTFKTVTMKEDQAINSRVAKALEEKLLENGLKNINTRLILSHCLVEIGKPGQLKAFEENSEAREKELENMSTLLVDKIAKRWNSFLWLLDYRVTQEMNEKKS